MAGPKSPYGYDAIFHDLLVMIHMESPERIVLEDGRKPAHVRALFHQFKTAWDHQAQIHHKRKEFQQEKACRQNYYKLMQYECRLIEGGVELVARASRRGTLRHFGRVQLSLPVDLDEASLEVTPFDNTPGFSAKELEEATRHIIGAESIEEKVRKSGPIITNNPPSKSDEIAFRLAVGRPSASPEELQQWMQTGEAPAS